MAMNTTEKHIRHYTYKELCNLYEISLYCLKKQLSLFEDELGEKNGKYFSARQAEIIFRNLGYPKEINEDLL
jgi:hypothetical protein